MPVIKEKEVKSSFELVAPSTYGGYMWRLTISGDGYSKSWNITFNPTSNCQVMSFNDFGDFITYNSKENVIKGLRVLYSRLKPQLLIDVKRTHVERVKEVLGEYPILFSTNYKSSNNSNMCVMLIRLCRVK